MQCITSTASSAENDDDDDDDDVDDAVSYSLVLDETWMQCCLSSKLGNMDTPALVAPFLTALTLLLDLLVVVRPCRPCPR